MASCAQCLTEMLQLQPSIKVAGYEVLECDAQVHKHTPDSPWANQFQMGYLQQMTSDTEVQEDDNKQKNKESVFDSEKCDGISSYFQLTPPIENDEQRIEMTNGEYPHTIGESTQAIGKHAENPESYRNVLENGQEDAIISSMHTDRKVHSAFCGRIANKEKNDKLYEETESNPELCELFNSAEQQDRKKHWKVLKIKLGATLSKAQAELYSEMCAMLSSSDHPVPEMRVSGENSSNKEHMHCLQSPPTQHLHVPDNTVRESALEGLCLSKHKEFPQTEVNIGQIPINGNRTSNTHLKSWDSKESEVATYNIETETTDCVSELKEVDISKMYLPYICDKHYVAVNIQSKLGSSISSPQQRVDSNIIMSSQHSASESVKQKPYTQSLDCHMDTSSDEVGKGSMDSTQSPEKCICVHHIRSSSEIPNSCLVNKGMPDLKCMKSDMAEISLGSINHISSDSDELSVCAGPLAMMPKQEIQERTKVEDLNRVQTFEISEIQNITNDSALLLINNELNTERENGYKKKTVMYVENEWPPDSECITSKIPSDSEKKVCNQMHPSVDVLETMIPVIKSQILSTVNVDGQQYRAKLPGPHLHNEETICSLKLSSEDHTVWHLEELSQTRLERNTSDYQLFKKEDLSKTSDHRDVEEIENAEEDEKSVAEEKKEHAGKARELLNWVSNVSNAKKIEGTGEHLERAPLPLPQMSSEEMEVKQEQISEILHSTQVFLAKHSDKMTDEEKNEMEEQLKSLQESYNFLSEETARQKQEAQSVSDRKVEEKVPKVIAGTIDETTGEILSIFQSVLQGLLDYETGVSLLETQLILSDLISPELGKTFELEEAKDHDLIDKHIATQLQELSNAKHVISTASLSGLPVTAAFEKGLISELVAVKMFDTQLSSECLILPSTGEQLSLNTAFQRNLISAEFFSKLLERQRLCKDLIDPITAERISLTEMLQRSKLHKETGQRLLLVRPQERGKITLKTGRKISILRAAHEGLMERESMFRLLGAQLLSGGIIEPDSGHRLSLEEALQQGLIDQDTACGILINQVKHGGILCPFTAKRLTVDEAVQCNLISSSSALLILEAQRGFIGLIWPDTSDIFPISTSLQQGMITNELAHKILSNRQKIAALYIPETSEILSLDLAAEMGIIDDNTATVLTNIILPDKMADMQGLESSCKNASKWLSSYEFQPSAFHEYAQKQDLSSAEEPMPHNPEETKQLFLSYLMINSYMDANTGERLLLFDGDLDEAVGMLLEAESYTNELSETEFRSESVYSNPNALQHPDNGICYEKSKEENKCFGSPNILEANWKQNKNQENILVHENAMRDECANREHDFAKRDMEQFGSVAYKVKQTQGFDNDLDIIKTGINLVEDVSLAGSNIDHSDTEGMLDHSLGQSEQIYDKQWEVLEDEPAETLNVDKGSLNKSQETLASKVCKADETEMLTDNDPTFSRTWENYLIENKCSNYDQDTEVQAICSAVNSMDSSGQKVPPQTLEFDDKTVQLDHNVKAEPLRSGDSLFNNSGINDIVGIEVSGSDSETQFVNDSITQQFDIDGAVCCNVHLANQNNDISYDNYDTQQYDASVHENEDGSHHLESNDAPQLNNIHKCDADYPGHDTPQHIYNDNYDTPIPEDLHCDASQNMTRDNDGYDISVYEDHQCNISQQITSDNDNCDILLPEDYHCKTSQNISSDTDGYETSLLEDYHCNTSQHITSDNTDYDTPLLEEYHYDIKQNINTDNDLNEARLIDDDHCDTGHLISSDSDEYATPHYIISVNKAPQHSTIDNNDMCVTSEPKDNEINTSQGNESDNDRHNTPPHEDNSDAVHVRTTDSNNAISTHPDEYEHTTPENTITDKDNVIRLGHYDFDNSQHNKCEIYEDSTSHWEDIPDVPQSSYSDNDDYDTSQPKAYHHDILQHSDTDTSSHPEDCGHEQSSSDEEYETPLQEEDDSSDDSDYVITWHDPAVHRKEMCNDANVKEQTQPSPDYVSNIEEGDLYFQKRNHMEELEIMKQEIGSSRQFLEPIPEEDTESTYNVECHEQKSCVDVQSIENNSGPSCKVHQTVIDGEEDTEIKNEQHLSAANSVERVHTGANDDLDARNNNAAVYLFKEDCIRNDLVGAALNKSDLFRVLALQSSEEANTSLDGLTIIDGPQNVGTLEAMQEGNTFSSEVTSEYVGESFNQKVHTVNEGSEEDFGLNQSDVMNGNIEHTQKNIQGLVGDLMQSEEVQQVAINDVSKNKITVTQSPSVSSDLNNMTDHRNIVPLQDATGTFATDSEIVPPEDPFHSVFTEQVDDTVDLQANLDPVLPKVLRSNHSIHGIKSTDENTYSHAFPNDEMRKISTCCETDLQNSTFVEANMMEKVVLGTADMSQENPPQVDNRDVKRLPDADQTLNLSSVSDQEQKTSKSDEVVQPITCIDTLKQVLDPANISSTKETQDHLSDTSPINIDHLGEIFHSSVTKRSTDVVASNELNINPCETVESNAEEHSNEFNIETPEESKVNVDLASYLKQCAQEANIAKITELNDPESCYCEAGETGENNVLSWKESAASDTGALFGEDHTRPLNAPTIVLQDTLKPEENAQIRVNIRKDTEDLCIQTSDQAPVGVPEADRICNHQISLSTLNAPDMSQVATENVAETQGTGFTVEISRQGQPLGIPDISLGPSVSENKNIIFLEEHGAAVCIDGVGTRKLQNIANKEDTCFQNELMHPCKEETSSQPLEHAVHPTELFSKDGTAHSPEDFNQLMTDIDDLFKNKDEVSCQQESSPRNDSDTKVFMQNVPKIISCTNLEDFSHMDADSNTSEGGATIPTAPCGDESNLDNSSFLWTDNRSPDLLDVLKQVQSHQMPTNLPETEGGESLTDRKQEWKPSAPELIPLQLDQIFQIAPDNEHSSRLEKLMSDLTKELFTAAQKTEGIKGKEDPVTSEKPYPIYSSGLPDFSSESWSESLTTPCASLLENLQRDHQQAKIHSILESFPKDMPGAMEADPEKNLVLGAEQQCSQITQKLREHLIVVQDMKFHLDNQQSIISNLETLKLQLVQLESFESGLTAVSVVLRKHMKLSEEFLKVKHKEVSAERLKDLKISHDCLQKAFLVVCEMSSKRAKQIVLAVDSEMSKLAILHQELLDKLQKISEWIRESSDSMSDPTVDVSDVATIKQTLQHLQNTEKLLADRKIQLDTTAFDIQFFISEHAQDLSPTQCKQLLRLLNTTQRSFQEVQERITSQLESLKNQLLAAQDLDSQKDVAEQQQEYKEKLQQICDLLTKTENRLIGQQDASVAGDSTAELQNYKMEHEELQKDMQAGASELAEIVKNTEKFLQENGDKLSHKDRTMIEQKLNEAKTKFELLRKRAEESKKELEKAVTTAIKQETEKVAAVEQLEESTHKIESLLDWLSNVEEEAENSKKKKKQKIEQNGTYDREDDVKSIVEGVEEVNGNLIHSEQMAGTTVDVHIPSNEKDLSKQYQKVKAQHEKLVSQHQDVIIATQSAQALLEKQGCYLAPQEKEKLQRNMKELKAQYETRLAESEWKMKQIQSVQEELEKFTTDYNEFESWLRQSKQELENLEIGAADFSGVATKLQRQKSFSEDVISHKGDLRYITISGQRVIDTAKSCNRGDGVKSNQEDIDTSATCTMVQSKLDTAADHFKSLYSKCNVLGNNLKDLVDKYEHYKDVSSGLLSGLQASETAANKRLSEPIAADPKNLQRQLEETKALQGQISTHQVAVEKVKKVAEVLLDTRGGLLPNTDEIQTTLDNIVERYDNLSKSVNDRHENLQITLTRSLSVQDGLDEMLDWLGSVEKGLKEQGQVPLNSAAIEDIISKRIMLEQDITSRQSSVNAMNEKVNKFMETADPSTASSLQRKMNDLSRRFSEASGQHKESFAVMEGLKTKVELFEGVSEKVQCFLERKSQALAETDAPGKDVTELSQYMQETNTELTDHKKDLEVLRQLLEEISVHGLPRDKALVTEKVNALSKKFKELEETVKEKEEDVSSCQSQMDTFKLLVESLQKWMKSTTTKIPVIQPTFCEEDLKKPLEDSKKLFEEWTSKGPEIQKVNQKGTSLCSLISAVTSPAKSRAVAKAGRAITNGEETASGAEGFLTNKELTAIQQDMSDVNMSYNDLGDLLREKVSELESRLSQVEQVQEDMNSMTRWLQQMEETVASWETASTDSTAVKAQVEQHKIFEAELKQNASKLQQLKGTVTELLEKNPDVPEAAKWKQMLGKIDSKWEEINQRTADRHQKLEESSNYLTQFQSAEPQLKQWLIEKELMASVLGPLSIDPNMLNTQKQQVQILLKEFDTRKPQYEQLNAAAQGILNGPGELPPSHEVVKEQLSAVAEKWDSLTGQLSDRCDRIDQAIVKSTEYQSLLKSLSDRLTALDNKLSSSLSVSTHPDAVKQQLATASEVQQEIKKEAETVKAARALCEELSALVREEYLKAELTRQLESTVKPLKDTELKADRYVEQLKSAYASSQQFQRMSKDFQNWLDEKKKEHDQAPPISAKPDTLLSLIEEQTAIQTSLADQLATYESITREGESLLQKTQGAEKDDLQSQLGTLKSNWEGINKNATERQDKLRECQQKGIKYREHVESLKPWLDDCSSQLSEIKVCIDPTELENNIGQVKSLQKNVVKQRRKVELLNSAAESVLNASETDTDIIRDEITSLNEQVDLITEQIHSKKDSLENMAQRLKEFQEMVKDTERQLQVSKEQLEVHNALGAQACSNKHLTSMQTQQKTLQSLQTNVELTKKLAQELVIDASDAAGVSDLLLQAELLEQDHIAISKQVEDKCSFLETKLQGIGHFQNSIREMFSQFAEFDDELDGMPPVARDRVTLLSQKEDINSFLKKLGDLIKSNENANKTCKIMLATETSTDLVGIKRDLEALSKQCNKLLDRAKSREEQVEGTLKRLEEWYCKLKDFSGMLGFAEKHEESQGQVGMETDAINQQLNIFQVFQKEEIEPLHVQLQEVNWLGQGLIQSAAKNTNTESLEHDLDDVNTRWNTLNKKVAERAAQLQEALLHCGRFQDALESLLCWLTDTEELVANQRPPSAEFKVVKAQIQEQKLLQRLLDDRKPTVEVIKREGGKIAESAEPADKEKILKQLDTLGHRWDVLLKKAEMRNRQLEGISVVAEQFHEALEPLTEWLSTTEKRLANSEPIGTQASKLQQQISRQKAVEEDIVTRNKYLHQAISVGQSLKAMSSREDKDMVQEILDSSQARYIDIQEKSSRRCELLQQAHFNAQIFGDDEVELMNWLNEAHDKLSKLSVQDYSPNVLVKQHAELLLLQEDISLRKQNVDQAIQNGLELLKQTTGDEVVIIQEKLDGIKARYSDITKLSCDVSKSLEQALQLADQLQSTHEELCRWLDEVEVELLSYEAQVPKGEELSQVQQRQKELQKEAKCRKGLLDSLNTVSSALLELVPWRAREGLDKMVTEDNERYRLVSDTITQKVQEIDAAALRSQQFEHAADAELSWIEETEKKLVSLEDIRLEQDQTTAQLQVQKAFTMEILRHKDAIDELVASADEIMNTEEEKQLMKNKLEHLMKKYDAVCLLNSERNLQLERAQSLVSQFWETYAELCPWLSETETIISQLPAPALEYETLKQQQEEIRQLRELIAEHKPHIDKMNKTGPQLLELSPGEGFSIQEKYVAADILYSKIKEDVKKRAVELDEAISQSSQFHDKIDPMLESLDRIADRLRQPPSISAEVEKIREQLSDNKNVSVELEKLQPGYETLKRRGEEMIARSEGADKDISAKAVQDKLDQMVFIWEDIQALTEEREVKLLDVMELGEKFWCDHIALVVTIKDTQDFIRELEEPGVDPSVVKQQQEAAEAIREEIDGLQEELDVVINLGAELIAACGEPDKPVVNKSIDELNSAWDTLNKTWKDRIYKLNEAMQAAVQYQDGLQAIFDWVDIAGSKLDSMPPIGTDLETVKQQIAELKQYKSEAYQQQIEMERLNHQKELLLKKVTDEMEKHAVQDSFAELKLLWNSLEEKIVNRQHKLEGALLALGQFQHALDELLTWLTHTEELLNEQKPVGGDPKSIEIALAKHHVLQNDVLAHESTVRTVKKAGNDLIESSAGEEASSLQSKLEALNQRWQNVLEITEQRRHQLDIALSQAQGFHTEIEDMQQWVADTERQLLASKPVGGLPETAREQLNSHLELCADFDAKEEVYKSLMLKGQQMLARCTDSTETNVEQDINTLQEKWESVQTKLNERKTKLEEALNLATDFHNSLQDFINWLTQGEQTLTMASPASLILDTVLFQIDEHKVFVTEVNSHRDQIIQLDKTGTHLKYFSQKQDVVLIKNLLISVQSRWENVVQRSVERGRALDDARKRAKQFHEAFNKLTEWLDESEKSLDSELEIANDPDKLKAQLTTHKEFQRTLGAKHSVYDTTIRSGRSLKEKASLVDDSQKLDHMLSEMRDKWDTVCGKSVERQNKLEEALLFSGQFTDALQALIDWLYRVEPQLAEDQPVHGDMDLVMNLIDNHKGFQKELGKRTSGVQALKRSSRELIESSRDDSSWVKVQMQELSIRWETVCALSVSKQTRLEQALRQAEEFHSAVHDLLEWLAEAEQALRFHGMLPDDEEALRALIDQHKEFMRKLEEKRTGLKKGATMGEEILTICHPDSITTIKHWITIIRARYEEVLAWAKQHQQRLAGALAEVISKQELLESLLGWLQWAETTLNEKDKEFVPEEIDEVKALIAEHQSFMEEMTRKQPDVDKLTKTYKRKAADQGPVHSHIPVPDKGRPARKRHPAPGLYPSGAQAQIENKDPRVNMLVGKWQQVWLLALERRRNLNDALDRLEELREFANFDFDVWRKKYMRWMNHKKSRVMDFFRRIDKDQDGKITRQEFIEGILSSKFPTSRLEMSAVADIFDRDGDGYIDYYEFVAALHPNKEAYKPLTDADKIEDEVTRQVAKCKCAKRFQVEQIGDNKYRFFLGNQFGDSQQLRLVRILRSTVMVRVGGGWMALDEFLVKNDPCRVHHHGSKMLRSESNSSITTQPLIAKGRTNMELREKFMLPEGVSQGMAAFRPRGRPSRPSSRGASPNRTNSVSSPLGQPGPSPTPATSTPKTPHPLTRNYGKPWLTNSKTSTPCKTPESPEFQVLSTEGTPIQGSKLRLPGYLSGKGFQSSEDSSLLSTAATRVRLQFAESKKPQSRPGSRAGSKAGSRRGSDASDFDISEIQSVCSDVTDTVHDSSRPSPRAGSRPSTGKPSKIPTPQRRSPASKLSKSSKR